MTKVGSMNCPVCNSTIQIKHIFDLLKSNLQCDNCRTTFKINQELPNELTEKLKNKN